MLASCSPAARLHRACSGRLDDDYLLGTETTKMQVTDYFGGD